MSNNLSSTVTPHTVYTFIIKDNNTHTVHLYEDGGRYSCHNSTAPSSLLCVYTVHITPPKKKQQKKQKQQQQKNVYTAGD